MTIPSVRPGASMLALAAVCCLAVVPALHAAPSAQAGRAVRYRRCDLSAVGETLGPTSVTVLKVAGGVTCDRGISLVKAFHTCRLAHGASGRCVSLVKGYACQEQRTNAPTQFTARVTCAKSRKSVVHSYTQNL
jgi:hypothetical protein